jgi:hypothetical protein
MTIKRRGATHVPDANKFLLVMNMQVQSASGYSVGKDGEGSSFRVGGVFVSLVKRVGQSSARHYNRLHAWTSLWQGGRAWQSSIVCKA